MRRLRDHGLTLALLALFLFSIVSMGLTGWEAHNQTLADHSLPPIGLGAYLATGTFVSAVFENWESEFLQMSTYVMLTAFLFQRGSAESQDPDNSEDEPPAATRGATMLGRLGAVVYAYSLGIALAALFVASFVLHLIGSAAAANDEAALHGRPATGLWQHLGDAQFWFESFQNWQSEFLSTAVLVVLSIFLRFRNSPESKSVDASHAKTGR